MTSNCDSPLDVLKWAIDNGAPWDERTRRLLRGTAAESWMQGVHQ